MGSMTYPPPIEKRPILEKRKNRLTQSEIMLTFFLPVDYGKAKITNTNRNFECYIR